MSLRPVLLDGKSTSVFVREDDVLVERRMVAGILPGSPQRLAQYELYTRLNPEGRPVGFFSFPIEFDVEAQTLSRSAKVGNGRERDIYTDKRHENGAPVFRAAQEADVGTIDATRKVNESEAKKRKDSVDPMFRDERQVALLANALSQLANRDDKRASK